MKHICAQARGASGAPGWATRNGTRGLSPLLAVVLAWLLSAGPSLQAQQGKATEYEVKAAYLYNFGKFVEWPAVASAAKGEHFLICVLGQDPMGTALDTTIAGEEIKGVRVVAKRIAKPQEALNCRILFISSSEEGQLKEILTTLEKASVLTVSDLPQFTRRGGMIQFVQEASRVRFEVNLTVAERAGLTLNSQLLKVAINVRRTTQPGD